MLLRNSSSYINRLTNWSKSFAIRSLHSNGKFWVHIYANDLQILCWRLYFATCCFVGDLWCNIYSVFLYQAPSFTIGYPFPGDQYTGRIHSHCANIWRRHLRPWSQPHFMYLMSEREGREGKYLARGELCPYGITSSHIFFWSGLTKLSQ